MKIKVIKTKKDYEKAIKFLEEIFDSQPGTIEGDELELLSVLIEKYEDEHYPISPPDPVEAIKFRLEQLGYEQKDVINIFGNKNRMNGILKRKQKLNLEIVRDLHKTLHIPLATLVGV
ncbi:MAG: hypothetical protein A3H98_02735 [Bacteroidetes bacterium RIFCSPLOWO2_02_FULL_36_8]|nr:MAG: hypothetical protein A3H98_02735 [Bacteroidetes bacterium RIFCSPLOWO2_02_FULL_36_8]OFY72199.1 MAG: hypothetical protein A3G23_01355 [Bacteroidetes bacterium RIFCSPLOWO2_12_FULL_37_12]